MTERKTHRVATTDDLEVSAYLEIAEAEQAAGSVAGSAKLQDERSATERDAIAVIDFGSQYSQLIARRIRECRSGG